jgi:hypothetical protein
VQTLAFSDQVGGETATLGIHRHQRVLRLPFVEVSDDVHRFEPQVPVVHEGRDHHVRMDRGVLGRQVLLAHQRHVPAGPGAWRGDPILRAVRIPRHLAASNQSFFGEREADPLRAGRPLEVKQVQSLKAGNEGAGGVVDSGHRCLPARFAA